MILIQEIIILLVFINIFDENIMFLYSNCAEMFKFVEKWGALGAILMARFRQSRASGGKRRSFIQSGGKRSEFHTNRKFIWKNLFTKLGGGTGHKQGARVARLTGGTELTLRRRHRAQGAPTCPPF